METHAKSGKAKTEGPMWRNNMVIVEGGGHMVMVEGEHMLIVEEGHMVVEGEHTVIVEGEGTQSSIVYWRGTTWGRKT